MSKVRPNAAVPRDINSIPVLQDSYRPAVGMGLVAGIVASVVLMRMDTSQSFHPHMLVYGTALFAAAFIAVQFTSSNLAIVCLMLNVGVAIGVFIDVCFEHGSDVGGRNLWPFEIALFVVFGFIPCWVALWAGRRFRLWYQRHVGKAAYLPDGAHA